MNKCNSNKYDYIIIFEKKLNWNLKFSESVLSLFPEKLRFITFFEKRKRRKKKGKEKGKEGTVGE